MEIHSLFSPSSTPSPFQPRVVWVGAHEAPDSPLQGTQRTLGASTDVDFYGKLMDVDGKWIDPHGSSWMFMGKFCNFTGN